MRGGGKKGGKRKEGRTHGASTDGGGGGRGGLCLVLVVGLLDAPSDERRRGSAARPDDGGLARAHVARPAARSVHAHEPPPAPSAARPARAACSCTPFFLPKLSQKQRVFPRPFPRVCVCVFSCFVCTPIVCARSPSFPCQHKPAANNLFSLPLRPLFFFTLFPCARPPTPSKLRSRREPRTYPPMHASACKGKK